MKKPRLSSAPSKNISNNVDVASSVFETGSKIYAVSKEYWRKHFAYTVVVSEKDQLYSEVFTWLMTISPNEKHRSLSVSSTQMRGDMVVASDSPLYRGAKPLTIRFNEGTSKTLRIDGHLVTVTVVVPEFVSSMDMREPQYSRIEFLTRSYLAQQAVLRELERINSQRALARKPVLKMVGQWNGWTTRSDLPPRTMDSVSLPDIQKKRIINDLKIFLESEEQYNRLAIPWHRGYMFHGPAGTGKTSLVKALAHEFNLDLWYVSLSDLKAESGLISLLSDVGPRSLLLLEDIDTVRITHDRDNNQQGQISMSSLLNTLDGVATPHGLITVMTTNRFDILDSALTRAGRMDLIEHLDFPSIQTLSNMYKHFYGVLPRWNVARAKDEPLVGLATSQVAEVMKRHMNDPRAASTAILGLIRKVKK